MRDPRLGVIRLEHQHLVRPHIRVVPPPLARALSNSQPLKRVQDPPTTIWVVKHRIRDMNITRRQAAGITDSQRDILRRRGQHAPDVEVREAPDPLALRSRELRVPLRGRLVRDVDVHEPRRAGVVERARILAALPEAQHAEATHLHVVGAGDSQEEVADLAGVDALDLLLVTEVLDCALVAHERESLGVERGRWDDCPCVGDGRVALCDVHHIEGRVVRVELEANAGDGLAEA